MLIIFKSSPTEGELLSRTTHRINFKIVYDRRGLLNSAQPKESGEDDSDK